MSLSRLSVRRPIAVAVLFTGVVFLGLISFSRLPIDLLPDVAYPRLVVYTRYPDVGPAEVERFVTEPIERQVGRVPGVQRVESVSREGVSLVTLRFAWGTDMDFAALDVREQLDNVREALPEGSDRPIILRTDPNAEPIIALSVAGRSSLVLVKDLAENVFKRRLEQIDGIAEAALTGGVEREIQVEVNPRLLEAYRVTLDEIRAALDAANQSAPGGTVLRGRYRYALRTLGEFQTVEEIEGVVVRRGGTGVSGSGTGVPAGGGASGSVGGSGGSGGGSGAGIATVAVRDVASVTDGFEERQSIARYNGRESVGLLLFKESGANTVRVTEEVERVLDQLRAQYPDVTIEMAMSQAGFISEAIANVVQALVFGGILAFLVLFLFLHDPRYPIAIALAIPISVVGAFALLDLAGVSLNIMSLGGLALGVGMLVDNSIVVLENVFRHREEGASGGAAEREPSAVRISQSAMEESAARGAEEVQGAITASTLTTIAVFGPVIYVEGVAGELLGDLSFAVAFALLASLVVALTLLPMMAARWKRDLGPRTSDASAAKTRLSRSFFSWFDSRFARFAAWYHNLLELALDHRGRVFAFAAVAVAVGITLGAVLDRDVLPDVDQGAFTIRLELPRGTPLERTAEAARRLEEVVLADEGVASVFARVGRQEAVAGIEDQESGLHTALLEVRLEDGVRTARVVDRVRAQLAAFPPGSVAIETGAATALGRLLGGADADLAVTIRGDDLDAAWNHARMVERRLGRVPSLANVRLGTDEGQPELRVEIRRDRAAAFGIEPRLVAQTVEDYMRGRRATEFVDFHQKIPVVVRLPEADRRSVETLRELSVTGVPLRELVDLHEQRGPSEIQRIEQGRAVTVFADVARGGLDGAVNDIRRALADVPPARGLRVEIGGANEERDKSFRDLAFAFALALILVYMILAAQFESLVQPFTILLAVPLVLVGSGVLLFATGGGLNTMSLIGMVILVGIVVNDAIVKVDFINQMRASGRDLRTAILEAGRVRLRPIVMTTVTTVLGLTPMAVGIGSGADLRAPLAIAVIGGLLSATALTLIVVPAGYSLVEEVRERALARMVRSGAQ